MYKFRQVLKRFSLVVGACSPLILCFSVVALAQVSTPPVFTCTSAPAGTALSPWPNCASTSYQAAGPNLIVAVLRHGAPSALWEPVSALQATDYVLANVPYSNSGSNWWPQTSFAWGAPPPPSVPATIQSVTIAWIPVTTTDKGAALTDLAGYRIYEGPTINSIGTAPYATVGAGTTSYTTPALPAGTYYFKIAAYSLSGQESVAYGPVLVSLVANSTLPVRLTCSPPTS